MNCKVWEVDEAPIRWKLTALAYAQVMDKTKPALEKLMEERAKAKARSESAKRGPTMGQGDSKSDGTRVVSIAESRRR